MRTRTSARLTNDNFSVLRPDVNDSFVLSSDESEAENFQVKYGPRNLGGLKEEKKSDTPKEIAKGRRGLRGKLEKINMLPLDIVLEIYSYLDPLDVLRLFRTSKDIRSFLMTRTNAIVWRKARSNVPDLPPLPLDLSEPQYASLAFESYCHICLRKPCENVFWQCRVRCCTRCFSTAFSSRPNLHSIWHRSYAGTFLVFDKIAPYIPYVSVTPWKGPWGGEDKVYFPPNIRALRHEYRRVRKGELILEDWVSQKKYRFECLMTHVDACSRWQRECNDLRAKDLQSARSRRKDAIYEHLRRLGWGEEIDLLDADGNSSLSSHKDVRQSKDLTERAWSRMKPHLVKLLEGIQSERGHQKNSTA